LRLVETRSSDFAWFGANTYHWDDWSLDRLLAAKGTSRVSLVVPARNEAATVGDVVTRVREALMETVSLLDEIVVIDSDSTDGTFAIAQDAGAAVYRSAEIRPDLGTYPGKGEAMWKSLFVTTGDVLVFMDADLLDWDTHFVPGLLGPMLTRSEVALVKGFYERPFVGGSDNLTMPGFASEGAAFEGGRVTELVARPLIALLHPELSGLIQPLAGEWAIRRELFASLPVPTGYAVELAALVDTVHDRGVHAIAQVDLGRRAHRHQALRDLGGMATQITAAMWTRAQRPSVAESGAAARLESPGPDLPGPDFPGTESVTLRQYHPIQKPPDRPRDRGVGPVDRVVSTIERPPARRYLR
jgi:glucosyl-3-phosphoglycerate synthase